jgi:hypothetical protein
VDLCALKLPRPVKFDGVSLKPLMSNPRADWPERTLVMGAPHNHTGPDAPPPEFGQNCAVMTGHWRLVNDRELYDLSRDPGQQHNIAQERPEVVNQLRVAYQKYWADVSTKDQGWRGRPLLGAPNAPIVELCCEDWFTTRGRCPWNQAAVAGGAAACGRWPVRFAAAGAYRIEVRRWPHELNASITGTPTVTKTVDAWLDGGPVRETLYRGAPQALPVEKARLKIGDNIQEADVAPGDAAKVFAVQANAGPADIEATLLDSDGKPLCSAYYVTISKTEETK